jgi:rubrerythrin
VLGLALGGGLSVLGPRVSSAHADVALDVQILQTASSLETLAVAVYDLVLGEDGPAARALEQVAPEGARDALRRFATETARQHTGHRKAFQDQTGALDPTATVQHAPNPKFYPMVQSADLSTPEKLLEFLAGIEQVMTDTYLTNLAALQDRRARAVVGGVMAVEAQHLAYLRLVGALLRGGSAHLVLSPLPLARMKDLPHTAGRVAFPEALHQIGGPERLAEPASGAAR